MPVKHFASNTFENLTIIDAKCVRSFALKLDHSAEPAVLRELYENLVRADEDALPEETLLVIVEESSEYSQTIGFYATAENPGAAWLMQARLSEKVGEWIRQNRPDWWSRIRLDRMHVDAHADHPEASARNVPSGKFKKF